MRGGFTSVPCLSQASSLHNCCIHDSRPSLAQHALPACLSLAGHNTVTKRWRNVSKDPQIEKHGWKKVH